MNAFIPSTRLDPARIKYVGNVKSQTFFFGGGVYVVYFDRDIFCVLFYNVYLSLLLDKKRHKITISGNICHGRTLILKNVSK